jgi:mono/diheme cytochrome c family protein
MFGKSLPILSTLFFAVLLSSFAQPGQNSGRNVLDRVYTDAQAERGAGQYEANCVECHEGNDPDGPTLLSDFIERWREDNLDNLFTFIKTSMPRDAPGKLPEGAYLDILTYILQRNGYPAGTNELSAGDLAEVRLVGRNGPQPLPNNALIRVAGCLVQQGTDAWTLTNASAPSRIRRTEESAAEDLKRAAAQGPGAQTFRLQNVVNPESHKGHKIQVKGVLSRQAGVERINVLLLEMLSPQC